MQRQSSRYVFRHPVIESPKQPSCNSIRECKYCAVCPPLAGHRPWRWDTSVAASLSVCLGWVSGETQGVIWIEGWCEKHVLVSQTGHKWHVAKYRPKSDKSRQNVFPRCPFLLPPSPKGGQPARDPSRCLHLCLIFSVEEYDHQHIHPSDVSAINTVIHAYWHTCRLCDLAWTLRPQALRRQQEKGFPGPFHRKKKCSIEEMFLFTTYCLQASPRSEALNCLIGAQITLKIAHCTISKSALASSGARCRWWLQGKHVPFK